MPDYKLIEAGSGWLSCRIVLPQNSAGGQDASPVHLLAVEAFCIAVLINNDEEMLYVCK
jgi:hypothetical protein